MNAPMLLATTWLLAAASSETVNFDQAEVGKPPSGWTATQTGTGQARWTVVQDETAPSKPNVLKQSGQATYPLCLKDDTSVKDGFVEVKLKALSGEEDQAGGLVWRAKDANNYYIARVNALEDNVNDLSHDQRSPHGEEARQLESRLEPMAHAARRLPGQSLHREPQRTAGARLG